MKMVSGVLLGSALFVTPCLGQDVPLPVQADAPVAPANAGPAVIPPAATAQPAVVATPVVIPQTVPGQFLLPSNTELTVTPNDTLSSKKLREGDTFTISTVYDVILNNMIVIPRGSRGQGVVVWRTGKGAFGKSAKMELELRWIEVGGRRVPIEGKHRQEGEGNTGATIGAVVAVGVFGAFVTGKSATVPNGMQLKAFTTEPLQFTLGDMRPAPQQATVIPAVVGTTQGAIPAAQAAPSIKPQ